MGFVTYAQVQHIGMPYCCNVFSPQIENFKIHPSSEGKPAIDCQSSQPVQVTIKWHTTSYNSCSFNHYPTQCLTNLVI